MRDLWLVSPEGGRVKALAAADGRERGFLFPLDLTKTTTVLRVEGDRPVIPAELGVSGDRRALLLLHPRALFLGGGAAGGANPR